MPCCVVLNCANRTERGVRLFGLPQGSRNEERRNVWIKNINRKQMPPTVFVCEAHFEQDQFESNRLDGRRPLKSSAIPTIFVKHPVVEEDYEQFVRPTVSGTRKSLRNKKIIRFKEYDSDTGSDEEVEDEGPKLRFEDEGPKLRCRACLSIFKISQGFALKNEVHGTSLKSQMLMFIPQLSLSDEDNICNACCKVLLKFTEFSKSCIDIDQKLKKGKISLEVKGKYTRKEIEAYNLTNAPENRGRKRKQELIAGFQKANDNNEDRLKMMCVPKKRGRPRKTLIVEGESSQDVKPSFNKLIENNKATESTRSDSSDIVKDLDDSVSQLKSTGADSNNIEIVLEDSKDDSVDTDHNYISEPPDDQNKAKYQCPVCKYYYCSLKGFRTHLIFNHNMQKNQKFKCPLCDKQYIHFIHMLQHKREHGFPCHFCEEIFPTMEERDSHSVTHPEKGVCRKCGDKFQSDEKLEAHTALHALMRKYRKPTLLKCDQCDRTFKEKHNLIVHVKSTHLKIKDIKCSKCDKKFCTETAVRSHIKLVHDMAKPFACNICKESFKRLDYLKNHELSHNYFNNPNRRTYSRAANEKEKQYQCPFCKKTETSKALLLKHLPVHKKGRKFECKYCGVLLSSVRTRYVHERTHETDPNCKFVCSTCWKRYPSDEALKEHATHHQANHRKFFCCLCNAVFPRQLILENHVLDAHVTADLDEDDDHKDDNSEVIMIDINDNADELTDHSEIDNHSIPDDEKGNKDIIDEYTVKPSALCDVGTGKNVIFKNKTSENTFSKEENITLIDENTTKDQNTIVIDENIDNHIIDKHTISDNHSTSKQIVLDSEKIEQEHLNEIDDKNVDVTIVIDDDDDNDVLVYKVKWSENEKEQGGIVLETTEEEN